MTSPINHHLLTDEAWLEAIKLSAETKDASLPGFPPQGTQEIVNGSYGDEALELAYEFWRLVKTRSQIDRQTKILDFGVGWGRILRFFLRDADPANLYGVDVDPAMINIIRDTWFPGNFSLTKSMQCLEFKDGFIDVAYAFSVFSHISEESAAFHLRDIVRTLKPNGKLFLTTTDMRFLDLCLASHLANPARRNEWEDMYAATFADPAGAKAAYVAGEYVFTPVGGYASSLPHAQYGWAAMPAAFVQRTCPDIDLEEIDDLSISEQAVFVLTKSA